MYKQYKYLILPQLTKDKKSLSELSTKTIYLFYNLPSL